jgi:hypothetical protein
MATRRSDQVGERQKIEKRERDGESFEVLHPYVHTTYDTETAKFFIILLDGNTLK